MKDGWTRTAGPTGGTLGATWTRGPWTILHCGHPTALWPYYARTTDRPGATLLSGGWNKGYAFDTLAGAKTATQLEQWKANTARK